LVVKQPQFTRVEEPTLLCNQVVFGRFHLSDFGANQAPPWTEQRVVVRHSGALPEDTRCTEKDQAQLGWRLAISDLELWAWLAQSLFWAVTTNAFHLGVCHILKSLSQTYFSDSGFYFFKASKQTPVASVLDENVAMLRA
jgi:hypothetical protein